MVIKALKKQKDETVIEPPMDLRTKAKKKLLKARIEGPQTISKPEKTPENTEFDEISKSIEKFVLTNQTAEFNDLYFKSL